MSGGARIPDGSEAIMIICENEGESITEKRGEILSAWRLIQLVAR